MTEDMGMDTDMDTAMKISFKVLTFKSGLKKLS